MAGALLGVGLFFMLQPFVGLYWSIIVGGIIFTVISTLGAGQPNEKSKRESWQGIGKVGKERDYSRISDDERRKELRRLAEKESDGK